MKQILITGGAKRLGRELAQAFAKEGYDIAIHYNNSYHEAEELVQELQNQGVQSAAFHADLSNPVSCEEMIDAVLETFPRLDTIINSASLFKKGSLSTSSTDDFIQNYMIHVVSPIRIMQLFTKSRTSGTIINILDSKISTNEFDRAPYLLAKKALAEVTKMAALEFAPHFRVNGVAPGYVLPPSDAPIQFSKNMNPLQKQNAIQSIIDSVMFLIHNEDITGQIIHIDGGARL